MTGERTIETVVDDAQFGEGPRWHQGALWFSDIGANRVWRVPPDGPRELIASTIPAPSGLGWTEGGDLLVASLLDGAVYRIGSDGEARPFCGPEQHGTLGTNDMATRGGRSYVTCAGRTHQPGDTEEQVAAPVGTIIAIDHDNGAARIVASGYRLPNGVAFTPDGAGLVVAELYRSRLLVFDIGEDGSLSAHRVFAGLPSHPDGICIDAEGAVWVGAASPPRFDRIAEGGGVLDSVPLGHLVEGGWSCVACALGGEDGCDLFMVLNKIAVPDDIFAGRAQSKILKCRVEVPTA